MKAICKHSVLLALSIPLVLSLGGCAGKKVERTLVTYNVGVFSKYLDNSIGEVANLLSGLGADYVALNELDSCNRRHPVYQLGALVDSLGGWQGHFASAFPFAGGAYGNGVATRHPVVGRHTIHLPKSDGSEERSVAVVETAECVFASVHLDHKGAKARTDQVATLTDWFRRNYGKAGKPVILCGDFNDLPDSGTIALMESSWTRLSGLGHTFSSHDPHECIDYVFLLKGTGPVEVLSYRVLTEGTADLSDHLPVEVKVRFGKR